MYNLPAYYDDPQAAPHVASAITQLERQYRILRDEMAVAALNDPADRAALENTLRSMLTALNAVADYDDETIRLTISHASRQELAAA